MKRIMAALLSIAILTSLFASCSDDKTNKADEKYHTVYFKDSAKSKKAVATFFNSKTGKRKRVKMKKISSDKNSSTFSCKGDCTVYNMVYFNNYNRLFQKVAFNRCVSGWYKTKNDLIPYIQGGKNNSNFKFDDITLKGYGYEKKIHIWKPDDYDASSDEKYSTIYVLDGQNVAYGGRKDSQIIESPRIIEQVKAMADQTGEKAIVVAIENVLARDFELVPEIGVSRDEEKFGEAVFEAMNGTQFADFIANTLVKYVQKHYNVYKDAKHTSVEGASLGGMEAFYIALEYPGKIGTAGALSPSFWIYEDKIWNKYLNKKSFNKNSPFLYFYTGGNKIDTDPHVTNMYNRLKKMGYPKSKMALHYNARGIHDGTLWRNVFSEFLSAMVYRKVEPLK